MHNKYLWVLFAIVFGYILIGAAIFRGLEAEKETEMKNFLEDEMNKFMDDNPLVNESALHGLLEHASSHCDIMIRMLHNDSSVWDYTGSMSFVVTVLTTIGYGHLAPASHFGKIVCVFYALVGIPLTLLLLNEVSSKLHRVSLRISEVNFCRSHPRANGFVGCALILSLGVFIMLIIPAAVIKALEGWTFVEGIYYCFITLSTIGFGDYIAGIHTPGMNGAWWAHIYKVGLFVWVLFGLAYLTLVIKNIMHIFSESIYPVETRNRQAIQEEIENLQKMIEASKVRLSECLDDTYESEKTKSEEKESTFSKNLIRRLFSNRKVNNESRDEEMSSFERCQKSSSMVTK
ncbi:potassium channel subfamily K member 16-like [Liolophura sinensis]|uniref:potassium channel subfamily K member 16-like n=1 Tax=Liolophura sinensis TaxID=3198878 RepID=UPI0031585977